jgi:hypothetical protein
MKQLDSVTKDDINILANSDNGNIDFITNLVEIQDNYEILEKDTSSNNERLKYLSKSVIRAMVHKANVNTLKGLRTACILYEVYKNRKLDELFKEMKEETED